MHPVPVTAVTLGALAFGATDEVLALVRVVQCRFVSSCSKSVTTYWYVGELSNSSRVENAQFRHRPEVAFCAFSEVVEVVLGAARLARAFESKNGLVVVLSVRLHSEDSIRLPR